jgi:hypothetical protein
VTETFPIYILLVRRFCPISRRRLAHYCRPTTTNAGGCTRADMNHGVCVFCVPIVVNGPQKLTRTFPGTHETVCLLYVCASVHVYDKITRRAHTSIFASQYLFCFDLCVRGGGFFTFQLYYVQRACCFGGDRYTRGLYTARPVMMMRDWLD